MQESFELMTLAEVADELRLTQQVIRRMIKDGKLVAYAPAAKILIPASEVHRLLAESVLSGERRAR